MIVNFTYDTDTKMAKCTLDGVEVSNLDEVCYYHDYIPYIRIEAMTEENKVKTRTSVYASENKLEDRIEDSVKAWASSILKK